VVTATGPDLSAGRAAVERLMDDTCIITADAGTADATVDPDTLQIIDPVPAVLYDGKCYVSRVALQPDETDLGETQVSRYVQQVKIPLSGPGYVVGERHPQRGDRVLITGVRRDPDLVGQSLLVTSTDQKSFAVARTIRCARTLGTGDDE
jgi:hypothetical protein